MNISKIVIVSVVAIIIAVVVFFVFKGSVDPNRKSIDSKDSITVVSFGGSYGATQKKHMIEPFVKETDIQVLFEDYTGGLAELKAQVESGHVFWDVVDMEYLHLERACSEGLLEIIPRDILKPGDNNLSAQDDFLPEAFINECAVGSIVWSVIFAYRNDLVIKPMNIKDFFDIEKIPGKRALKKRAEINLEWALIADGVDKSKVYEILATESGVKRAFKKLDSIKKDIIWFDSWSQPPQLLNDGSVVMSQSANGRIYRAIKDNGSDFTIVWQGQMYDLDGWVIPKGSKNLENALRFITFTTETKPLSTMQLMAYGPTRKSSQDYISDAVKAQLPTAHLDKGLKVDSVFWADNVTSLNERFSAWLLKR